MAATTGAATHQAGRARRNTRAEADPAARLGTSTPSRTKNGDRAWVSSGPGGATSVTASGRPDPAATEPNAVIRAWVGAVPAASATSSRRCPGEAISAPSTSACAIAARAAAALG